MQRHGGAFANSEIRLCQPGAQQYRIQLANEEMSIWKAGATRDAYLILPVELLIDS